MLVIYGDRIVRHLSKIEMEFQQAEGFERRKSIRKVYLRCRCRHGSMGQLRDGI